MTKAIVKSNESIKKEMESIIWSAAEDNKDKVNTKAEVKVEIKEEDKVEVITDPIVEDKTEDKVEDKTEDKIIIDDLKGTDVLIDNVPEVEKKKRNVSKTGDKDWVDKIPENDKYTTDTIFCFRPGKLNKIGRFISYGKKEGIIWVNMFKKSSTEYMSKPWAVKIDECSIVENKSEVNPEFSKEAEIYYTKKDYEAKKAKELKNSKSKEVKSQVAATE